MSDVNVKKPGVLFWVLGAVFLIWNLFGCIIYYMDMTMSYDAYVKSYGEEMAQVREFYPTWSVAAYAIAVWGGLLAAILYLLKKKWAAPLFVISLICAIISFIWGFTNADYKAAAGGAFWVMPVIVVVLGIFEVWWSRKKSAQGILS